METFRYEALASLAYELPDEILKYRMAGDLEGAKEAIDRWLSKPQTSDAMKQRLQMERIFLARLQQQFPFTKEEAVRAFREKDPKFSEADLERLDKAGLAEWIWLDGQKAYIHNVVRNVLHKDPEIRKRAGLEDEEAEEKQILIREIQEMKEKGSSSWKFCIRASIRLKDEEFTPGMRVTAHLPLPAVFHQVKYVKILSCDPAMKAIDPEDAPARTIYFEDTLQENREFFVEYEYVIKQVFHDLSAPQRPEGSQNAPCPPELQKYLQEQVPHIRFTPYLRALAAEITQEESDPLEKARKIFQYITSHVKYSFMRDYFLLEDIPQYCARNLRGDCGVQALLFITLCRICGIPAKWQSGLYTHPCYIGSHDWAMFYAEPYGWLFADLSFGGSAFEEGDVERRSFYFGNLDPFRMPANHAFQQPFLNPKNFWPIDPYDNQQGELESEDQGFRANQLVRSQTLLLAEKL